MVRPSRADGPCGRGTFGKAGIDERGGGSSRRAGATRVRLRLDRDPRTTWSGTPWSLREATAAPCRRSGGGRRRRSGAVLGSPRARRAVGPSPPGPLGREVDGMAVVAGAAAAQHPPPGPRPRAASPCSRSATSRSFDRPYFVYQDLAAALVASDELRAGGREYIPVARHASGLESKLAWQRRVYAGVSGVFAMRPLARRTSSSSTKGWPGVGPRRAARRHLALGRRRPAGAARRPTPPPAPVSWAASSSPRAATRWSPPCRCSGARVDPAITLTVAGPRAWPLPGPPPRASSSSVPCRAGGSCPDRRPRPARDALGLEGFGIAFVEALGRGVPCIGRRDCAMTEYHRRRADRRPRRRRRPRGAGPQGRRGARRRQHPPVARRRAAGVASTTPGTARPTTQVRVVEKALG